MLGAAGRTDPGWAFTRKARLPPMTYHSLSHNRRHAQAAMLLLSAAILAVLLPSPAAAFREPPDVLRDPSTLRLQARAVIEGSSLSLLPSTAATRAEARAWESPAHRNTRVPLDTQLRSREERDGLRWERVSFVSETGQVV